MYITHLSDSELINYLDLVSDDPLIRRLIPIVSKALQTGNIDKWQHLHKFDYEPTVSEYIEKLESMIDNLTINVEELNEYCGQLDQKITALKTKTVVDLITELNQEILLKQVKINDLIKENTNLENNAKTAIERLDTWTVLSS